MCMTEEFVTGVDPGKVFGYGEINPTLSSSVNRKVFGYGEFHLSPGVNPIVATSIQLVQISYLPSC